MSGRTILVWGLPKDVLKEDLQIYFQSKSKSGGGDIASIEVDNERGEARIEFEDASVMEVILSRAHEYQGSQLTVEEYKPSTHELHQDKPECTSVVVRCAKDVIELSKCTRRSEGVEVKDIEVRGDESVVNFESSDVAKRVLARTHELQGCQLTVEENHPFTADDEHQDESKCTSVLVSGLSDKCTKEVLELYFESTRRSDGGDVTDVQVRGDKAVVTFASSDVAKRVLARTHAYQGCQLTVEEYKLSTHECTSVLVRGLSDQCTKEVLELYFESTRGSGGGDVTEVQVRGDKAVVTFASPDVAKRVLARTHELQGCQLTVEENYPFTADDEQQDESKCTSVLVSGFSDKCTKEVLELYFESNRRSDGGEVTDVQVKRDKAVVTFASSDVAKRVVARTHELQGCQLTVEENYPFTVDDEQQDESKCASVLVSGLSVKCTKEFLELYFESNRRSDGGEVKDVQVRGDKAVVTFASTDVAKRVLARTHAYQGCQLTVEEYKLSTHKCTSVLVRGLSDKCTKEVLELYFESTRGSGGGDVTEVQVRGDKAVVTFASSDVAKRVLARTHELQGCQLTVEENHPFTADDEHQDESKCTSVLVSGLSEKCTKEVLELYFESTRGSDGGEVTDVQVRGDKAVVTFKSSHVTKRVLARTHKYQGCQLTVEEYKPPKDEGTSILVSGLSEKCTKDTLELYFENARRSGGGEVTDVEVKGEKAVVTFASSDVAKGVLARNHDHQGCQLTVEEYKPSTDKFPSVSGIPSKSTNIGMAHRQSCNIHLSDSVEVTNVQLVDNQAVDTSSPMGIVDKRVHFISGPAIMTVSRPPQQQLGRSLQEEKKAEQPLPRSRVVRVSADPAKITEDTLSIIFANKRLSGGGKIEDINCMPKEGMADITFCYPEDAEQVSQKKNLEFDGARFTMVIKKEISKDPKALHVTGIREMSKEKFIAIMEWICEESVDSVVFGSNLNAIVTFESPPDFCQSRSKCSTRALDGSHLKIEQVNTCDCIEVTGLAPNTTKDIVLDYFDDPRNGGSEVKNVEMDSGDTRALVFFEDSSVLNNVTEQEHTINGAKLKMVPYYPMLGEISASPTQGNKEKIVKVDPQTMSLINELLIKEFDQLLQDHRIKYTWQPGSGEIVLSCAELKMDKKTWENSCEAVVAYINQIVTEKITVSQEAWKEMCEEAKEKCAPFKDQVAITFNEKERSFILTGKQTNVSELLKELNDLEYKIKKKIEFDKSKLFEKVRIAKVQIELLKMSGFFENLQARCKNLEVKLLENDETISFGGPQDVVRESKETVSHMLTKVKEREMELHKSIVGVVCSHTGKTFMKMQFKQANITAVVSFDPYFERELIVTAMSKIDLKKAVDLIKDLTSEQSIPLDDHQKQLIHSEKWKQLKQSIQQKMLLQVREEPAASTLGIAGIKEEVDNAREMIDSFFEDNIVLEKMVDTDIGRVKYIFKYEMNVVRDIESSLKHYSVEITKRCDEEIKKNGILVSGTTKGLKQAVSQIEKLINDIKDRKVDLETQGIKRRFRDKKGTILLSGVENNHNCIIELCTQKHDTKPSSFKDSNENKSLAGLVCSYVTPEGKKIVLYKGDLTKHKADIVVNPANEQLKHDCGVGKKIIDEGGQEIQDECYAYVKKNGNLKCSEVLVTGTGKLSCKKLIHAVGPKWNQSASSTGSKEEKLMVSLLGQTMCNSFKESETFSSIAIPAISAGASGCPVNICAKTLIESTLGYSKKNPNSKLTEFHFVDMNDSVITAFHKQMSNRFGKKSSFKEEVTLKTRAKSTKETATGNVGDDLTSLTTAQGMKVKTVVNDIAKMKTHVIVNTVAPDLDLSKNPCAKALSNAAGPGLQQECKTKGSLSVGQILVTDAYNLGCKKVFHVVVGNWQNGKGEPILRSLIQSCLTEADKRGLSSIAFPALGTGNLGFPRNIVARAFFEEADNFRGKNPQSLLTKVHIVLFHKDQPTVQVFQQEVKNRKTKGKKKGKRGSYKGSISSSPSIGSVRLDIILGDITKETADAIVIPATLNLEVAAVGKLGIAVNEVGGPGIQQECAELGPQNGGSVVCTSPGSLPAGKIFHLVFDSSYPLSRLTEIIEKCLQKADTMGITSIAVPAIGTGKGGMSPKDAAKALLFAVGKFSQGKPVAVNHIRIVVFENHMMNDFHNAIHDLSESKTGTVSSLLKGVKAGVKGNFVLGEGTEADAMSHKSISSTTENEAEEKMWLQVFAASCNNLNEAEASIKELIQENSKVLKIEDKNIGKLSQSQIDRIQQHENLSNIQKIQIDKMSNSIIISGDSEDINNVRFAIHDILNEKAEEEHTRRYAELLAENVQWYYMNGGTLEPYDDETNAQIEQAYKNQEPTVTVRMVDEGEEDDPSNYQIDFNEMTERDLGTGESIQVERKSKATGIQLPVHWDPQPTDSNGKELDVHLVPLDQNTKEYDDVKKAIEKTSAINIIKIERVQNPSRYRAYVVKKHEMDNKNGSNEKKLFHGTTFATCQLINLKGFNRSYCGKNATCFGKGVYFARDALYSMDPKFSPPDSAGNRYMYLVSVLAGEYTNGTNDMIAPPPKDPNIPTITYDSVVSDVSDLQIFVVFHDDQNYPEYLITFK